MVKNYSMMAQECYDMFVAYEKLYIQARDNAIYHYYDEDRTIYEAYRESSNYFQHCVDVAEQAYHHYFDMSMRE